MPKLLMSAGYVDVSLKAATFCLVDRFVRALLNTPGNLLVLRGWPLLKRFTIYASFAIILLDWSKHFVQ